jgi:trans-aconitate 2-methyltransferase
LRLRPALDLLSQVGDLPSGDIVDLGCGDGAAAEALKQRYPKHRLVGLDSSPAMLGKAKAYDKLHMTDAAIWHAETPPALIFSNAALHWLPDHANLMPRLAGMLAPGGVLAVQMPRQYFAPSHRFLRDIAAALFPDRFDFSNYDAPVLQLDPITTMHPVRAFTQSTAMRPYVQKLTQPEVQIFTAAYDQALIGTYPLLPDGSCLMPFRRVFFTVKV